MKKAERIYLIGFMGSGKSTMGKALAADLGWNFTDLDTEIEKSTGLSIPELFRNNGQTEFRKLEAALLRSTAENDQTVIACGGGTACFHNNMEWMLENGLVLYLKYTAEQLRARLAGTEKDRPVLKETIGNDPHSGIDVLLRDREVWYNRAHVAVDAGHSDIAHLSTALKEIVEKWRKGAPILYT